MNLARQGWRWLSSGCKAVQHKINCGSSSSRLGKTRSYIVLITEIYTRVSRLQMEQFDKRVSLSIALATNKSRHPGNVMSSQLSQYSKLNALPSVLKEISNNLRLICCPGRASSIHGVALVPHPVSSVTKLDKQPEVALSLMKPFAWQRSWLGRITVNKKA